MKTFRSSDSTLNLCDYCGFCIPDCNQEVEFGDGVGEDNVIQCQGFDPIEEPPADIKQVEI